MSQVTVTADYGPGLDVTAIVIPNVVEINYDLDQPIVSITYIPDGQTARKIRTFDLTGITTVTTTVGAAGYTVVIS